MGHWDKYWDNLYWNAWSKHPICEQHNKYIDLLGQDDGNFKNKNHSLHFLAWVNPVLKEIIIINYLVLFIVGVFSTISGNPKLHGV